MNDAVTRAEKVTKAAQERFDTWQKTTKKQYPRALGSEPVSTQDELLEFSGNIYQNPDGVAQLFNSWRDALGDDEQALEQLIGFIERNERRIQNPSV